MNLHELRMFARGGFLDHLTIEREEDGWSATVTTKGPNVVWETIVTARGEPRIFTSLDTVYKMARGADYMGPISINDGAQWVGTDGIDDEGGDA